MPAIDVDGVKLAYAERGSGARSITLPDYGRAAERLAKARPATEIVEVPQAGHVLPCPTPMRSWTRCAASA